MNSRLERFIDRRLGVVICFFLTIVEKICRILRPDAATLPPVKRVIFIKPVEQGAIILAYGAVMRAVEQVGRENVFFFVFQKNREIVEILNVVPEENVITARDSSFPAFCVDMIAAIIRMRRLRIDTAVDLEIFARISIIIAWLSGARRRVGLHRFNMEGPYRGGLVTHRVQFNPYLHTAQAFDVFVRAAFAAPREAPLLKETPQSPPCTPPRLIPDGDTAEQVDGLLKKTLSFEAPGQKPYPLFLFNPKCQDELPSRKWPDARYVELGRRLLDTWPEGRILITGLDHERGLCQNMAKSIDAARAFSLAGKLTLRSLVVLMTRCDILVSSDSGPAHFAALTDIAGVVLFGPETPLLYSPLSERLRVMYLGLACSPCYSPMNYRLSPCSDNRCLQDISADAVYSVIQGLLERSGSENSRR
ncbi:MAG TPA: glycosyltransferase family 9 protein [Candidatus Hydrogenedentes bacterium]|nr:glycosyltransferase family 9 protein [Candidatus Hydrogenedentota bacterium]